MNLFARVLGLGRVLSNLALIRRVSEQRIDREVENVGEWAVTRIRELAPVGSEPDSPFYRGTIEGFYEGDVFVIGTGEPYGARLEFGGSGVDSLGRRWSQAPRPHFRPVAEMIPSRLQTHIKQVFD